MSIEITGPVFIDRGEGLETVEGQSLALPSTPIPMPLVLEKLHAPSALGWFWPERYWYWYRAWDRDPFTRERRVAYNFSPAHKLTPAEAEEHYVFVREVYWEGDASMWQWVGTHWQRIH